MWVVNLIFFAGFLFTRTLVIGGIVLATLIYIGYIACPNCGLRLSKNRRKWIYLVPAKSCLGCGYNLTSH